MKDRRQWEFASKHRVEEIFARFWDHCDPAFARSGDVDRRLYRSRRGDELEIGKALDDDARQRGSLTHDTDDVERQQALNHGIWIGKMVVKYGDIRPITRYRPNGGFQVPRFGSRPEQRSGISSLASAP